MAPIEERLAMSLVCDKLDKFHLDGHKYTRGSQERRHATKQPWHLPKNTQTAPSVSSTPSVIHKSTNSTAVAFDHVAGDVSDHKTKKLPKEGMQSPSPADSDFPRIGKEAELANAKATIQTNADRLNEWQMVSLCATPKVEGNSPQPTPGSKLEKNQITQVADKTSIVPKIATMEQDQAGDKFEREEDKWFEIIDDESFSDLDEDEWLRDESDPPSSAVQKTFAQGENCKSDVGKSGTAEKTGKAGQPRKAGMSKKLWLW